MSLTSLKHPSPEIKYSLSSQSCFWDKKAKDGIEFKSSFDIDLFNKYLNAVEDGSVRILDVGCGYGRILNILKESNYHNLHGVDHSKRMIKRGKSKFPWLDLRLTTKNHIPFEDNYFDAVVLFSVLTCIAENKDQIDLIAEIRRVLKPNGIIYLNDYLISEDEESLEIYSNFLDKYNNYGVFELEGGGVCRDHKIEWIQDLLVDFEFLHYKDKKTPGFEGNLSYPFTFQLLAKLK